MEPLERPHATPEPRRPALLGDLFYLVAHDVQSGRARVDASVASLGLAAALLCELVVPQHVVVAGEVVAPVLWDAPPPGLGRTVWERMATAQDRTGRPGAVADWLRFLALDAVDDVRARLAAQGWLTQVRTRRWVGGPRVSFVAPRGTTAAAWPPIGLAKVLDRGVDAMALDEVVLAALVAVTGLVEAVPVLRLDCPGRDNARAAYERLRRVGEAQAGAALASGAQAGEAPVAPDGGWVAAPVMWQGAQVLQHAEAAVGVGILTRL